MGRSQKEEEEEVEEEDNLKQFLHLVTLPAVVVCNLSF